MSRPDQIEIERLRYWHGQELRSRDFRDQITIEAQLRWWHNRALHNAFGVRYGLTVSSVIAEEKLVAVRVDCGVAYDCFGRELILQTRREIPLPVPGSTPASLTLLIRYKEALGKKGMASVCTAGGFATQLEQPEFLWKPSAGVEVSDGVPMAQLSYEFAARLAALPAGIEFPISLAGKVHYDAERKLLISKKLLSEAEKVKILQLSNVKEFHEAVERLAKGTEQAPVLVYSPRVARPLARPRIGSGATVPEGTAWERWSERVSDQNRKVGDVAVGYQVIVDTAAAGFTETPCYFAWLEGTLWERSNIGFFPVPLTHIDLPSPRQFTFRLWLPMITVLLGARIRKSNSQFESEFINFARKQRLYVCWLGIQPRLAEMPGATCVAVAVPECFTVKED
jgi:hypothetical protein